MARQTASYLMKKQRMQKRVESAKAKFRDLGIPAKWKEMTPKKVAKERMRLARRLGQKLFIERQLGALHENQCFHCHQDMSLAMDEIDWEKVHGQWDFCETCCCGSCGTRRAYPGARCCG